VHPRVISTPHIAGSTIESQRESVIEIVEGIRKYIRKELPTNVLNPQVFQKSKKQKRKITFDFDSVIFDCDSTLSKIEGIDELGKMVGVLNISDLTKLAMNGELSFETVYEKRLDRIKPSRHLLARLGQMYIDTLVEDAIGVIASLHQLKKNVFIVSGGFLPSLLVLGKALGIPPSHIFGNDLLFDNQGNYVSFVGGPLKRNDGKLQIIRQIPGRKLMVGDSITDLETKECVDQFVGFGGVIRREIVENHSDIYLYSESLAPILILAAGKSGCEKLLTTAYRKYVGKGLDLLSHTSHVKVKKTSSFEVLDYKAFAYLNSL
jgi:phosphoserine phosphatase